MKRWNLKEMLGNGGATEGTHPIDALAVPRQQSYIEESFAYAAYCASRVEGAERVCFEEFMRRWPRE